MFEKVQRNLIWWNVVVVLSVMAVIVLAMYFSISNSIEQEVSRDLTDSASRILQATRFVPDAPVATPTPVPKAVPTPAPTRKPSTSEKDKEDKEDDEKRPALNGRLETRRDLRVELSGTFYFLLDLNGGVLQNSRQITSTGLPDLTVLKQVANGETVTREFRMEDGTLVETYSVPVRIENGQVVGMIQVGKDLSAHQKQLQDVLIVTGIVSLVGLILTLVAAFLLTRHSLIPIRTAMERQRGFIADASHELRTPLTLIRANAEVALRNKKQTIDQNADLLEDICEETEHLGLLVTDLLTLAQADMNKLEYKPEPLELNRMSQDVVRQLTPLADAKHLNLKLSLEGNQSSSQITSEVTSQAEIWLKADRLRLRQLLLILLDNAIKYTNEGEVRLSVSVSQNHGPTSAVIKVSDSGIGIPQDKLKHIFERFYRVDKARTRSAGGFGLGLSIASMIVTAHKGTIEVDSEIGRGTTFTVTLPIS
jgi:signal transduction histidine kinase